MSKHIKHMEPSYGEKINTIKQFIENPCFEPWLSLLELAEAPAGNAVLQFITPSLTDVVRAYIRPKGARFGGHFRNRKSKRKKGWFPEDTSEIIGKVIPGRDALKNRQVSRGVLMAWAIDGLLQELLFYWMVADIGLDFFYEWTSAIMESNYCSKKGQGAAAYSGGLSATKQDSRKGLTQGVVLYRTGDTIMTDRGSGGTLGTPAHYSVWCTTWGAIDDPPTFDHRLIVVDAGNRVIDASPWTPPKNPGEQSDHIVHLQPGDHNGGTPYIETSIGKGLLYMDSCYAWVQE